MEKLISKCAQRELMDYLSDHEYDIAFGINDFGRLRSLFVDMFDRQPSYKLEPFTEPALDNG